MKNECTIANGIDARRWNNIYLLEVINIIFFDIFVATLEREKLSDVSFIFTP